MTLVFAYYVNNTFFTFVIFRW